MTRDISTLFFFFILQSAARGQEFFNTTPQPIKSNFTCIGRITGYYADLPSNCRVYHNCDDQGNKFSYYCPEMTAFRQEALICDHAHLVDCQAGTRIGKKTSELQKKNEDQSKPEVTTRTADRYWTTANPFRDFLLSTGNLTVRHAQKNPSSTNVTSKAPGSNHFGFHRGSFSGTDDSGFGNNQESKSQINDRGQSTLSEQNSTRFFGNSFERLINSKEILLKSKTGEDQITVNSRSHPAWYNRGDDFRRRGEIGVEDKPDDRHAESTTSRFIFGQSQTTKNYFNSKNNNRPRFDKAERKSSGIEGSASFRNFATTPSTTPDIPLRDFTASLKPLVPNALEYDPYYPRESWTSTESYYTPIESNKLPRALEAPNFEPSTFGVYFKVPDVWPDLNTLDDIVDRRKLFYIPKSEKF